MAGEDLFIKRIQELAKQADRRGCVTFTDFLNLNEQNILHQTLQKFSWIKGETFGGYEGAERQIAAFVPGDIYYEWKYPISCIRIRPLNAKFAEELSHRDILGALMHLGIERDKTGDIAVCQDEFFLFCCDSMADLICRELTRIRHTSVYCEICSQEDFSYTPETKQFRGSVASVRLDAVMALAFQSSRSSLLSLIEDARVFVNGKLITTNAYTLKEMDIVSVRGMGRFRYTGVLGQTKKGRCMVEIEKYI
ncbi:MAG: YlmH/Sll1252 family protein [Lachnospiraceae bacterium]|nr:YlmH/Sll1252 family protein [Lachnospiraceae bacterium]